ncbi:MAG: adenylate/guanylate cyclase domain-containing protein [Bacteroidetes bacterium]|nr:adenylate/guanylate cyclase domain-containing protein [Bacteroidota bacterium]MDA1119418.1 adenylate/guanylate cyclase domain-containing protein [Bacteroidota bacterium]
MNSHPNIKTPLIKIFWITIAWTIVAVSEFFTGLGALTSFKCDLSGYDPFLAFKASALVGLMAGTIGGSVVVFLWEKWLRTKNYGWSLISIFFSYSLIYLIVSLLNGLFFHSTQLNLSIVSGELWSIVFDHLTQLGQFHSFFFWLAIVAVTLITMQVNDKYGPGVFIDFILGKYFKPRKEERIFMFLDLRSSTSIAEKLGEERYFSFLKDVFQDSTGSILNTKGEIYQYVGDEIVISWKTNNGVENANCVHCFFEVQKALNLKETYYKEKYDGMVPEFKAGLHYGYVMAGEIGVIKRDIVFSGDVLNTTARIQAKCNEMGVNILLSDFLFKKLDLSTLLFEPKKMGGMDLRGKELSVMLYTV